VGTYKLQNLAIPGDPVPLAAQVVYVGTKIVGMVPVGYRERAALMSYHCSSMAEASSGQCIDHIEHVAFHAAVQLSLLERKVVGKRLTYLLPIGFAELDVMKHNWELLNFASSHELVRTIDQAC
jgi:hypothetical protein